MFRYKEATQGPEQVKWLGVQRVTEQDLGVERRKQRTRRKPLCVQTRSVVFKWPAVCLNELLSAFHATDDKSFFR